MKAIITAQTSALRPNSDLKVANPFKIVGMVWTERADHIKVADLEKRQFLMRHFWQQPIDQNTQTVKMMRVALNQKLSKMCHKLLAENPGRASLLLVNQYAPCLPLMVQEA